MNSYELLERRWAERTGAKPSRMVGCSSGTAALHLALESLQLPKNSIVLVPDYTMIACARAVVLAGLTPYFVDCRDDLLIDPTNLDDVHTNISDLFPDDTEDRFSKVSAIMAVHIYGRRCDMEAIDKFAARHGIAIIEDLAEGHTIPPYPGAAASCWSFYRNKVVAGEEGGAVQFNTDARADTARSLRCMGFTPAHDYSHIPRGHNYRLSNVHADLIIGSIANMDKEVKRRLALSLEYDSHCPDAWRMPIRSTNWIYDIRIPFLTGRIQDRVITALRAAGIEGRHGFKPMREQQEFLHWKDSLQGEPGYTRARKLSREVIYFPLSKSVTTEQIKKGFEIVKHYAS